MNSIKVEPENIHKEFKTFMPIERIQFIKFKKGCFKNKFPLYENEDL